MLINLFVFTVVIVCVIVHIVYGKALLLVIVCDCCSIVMLHYSMLYYNITNASISYYVILCDCIIKLLA